MKNLSEITVFDSLLIYFFDWQEGVMSNNKKREKGVVIFQRQIEKPSPKLRKWGVFLVAAIIF